MSNHQPRCWALRLFPVLGFSVHSPSPSVRGDGSILDQETRKCACALLSGMHPKEIIEGVIPTQFEAAGRSIVCRNEKLEANHGAQRQEFGYMYKQRVPRYHVVPWGLVKITG